MDSSVSRINQEAHFVESVGRWAMVEGAIAEERARGTHIP